MNTIFHLIILAMFAWACSGSEASFTGGIPKINPEDINDNDEGNPNRGRPGNEEEPFVDICESNPKDPSCFTEKGEAIRNMAFNLATRREIPLVKTVLIVDNSNSMSEEQTLLANGLKALVDRLKGLNIDLYMYTTTQFPDNYSEVTSGSRLAISETNTIDANGNIIEHGNNVNRRSIAKVDLTYQYIDPTSNQMITSTLKPSLASVGQYDVKFTYNITPNLFAYGAPLSIRTTSTNSDIENIKAKLQIALTQLGTLGSDREAGLCSLIRLVYDQGQNKIFNQGDNVAFVLLTDQDDESDLQTCLPDRKVTVQYENYNKYTNNDVWEDCSGGACVPTQSIYRVKRNYNKISFTCTEASNNDGVLSYTSSGKSTYIYTCGNDNNCQYVVNSSCNATQLGIIAGNTGFSTTCRNSITNCKVIAANSGGDFYHQETYSSGQYVDEAVGCQAVRDKWQGSTPHIFDFDSCYQVSTRRLTRTTTTTVETRIKRSGITKETGFFSDAQKDAAAASNDKNKLIDTFVKRSKELFGDGGFLFSAIMRDEEKDQGETCPAQNNDNQAWGLAYKSLAAKLGTKGIVHSICATDYGPALEKVEGFIRTVAESSHQVSLTDGERVHKVFRVRDGDKKELVIGTEVKIVGFKLEFLTEVRPTDSFEVQIAKPL